MALKFVVLLLALLFAGAHAHGTYVPCSTRVRSVTGTEWLLHRAYLDELHAFYNANMDQCTAIRSVLGPTGTNAEFEQRVSNVVNIFCEDPIFQGWTARGGVDAATEDYAAHRNTPQTYDVNGPYSVYTIYHDLLPGYLFINSSQHLISMSNIAIWIDAEDNMCAEYNATLRQILNEGPSSYFPNGAISFINGRYNNYFLFNQHGGTYGHGYWCMQQFNANNGFAVTLTPGPSVYTLSTENAVDAYLGYYTRPDPRQ